MTGTIQGIGFRPFVYRLAHELGLSGWVRNESDRVMIEAEVPLAEVTTYARSLSSITGGRGSYTIEFSHYDVVPGNVQQEIIAKAKLEEEEED